MSNIEMREVLENEIDEAVLEEHWDAHTDKHKDRT